MEEKGGRGEPPANEEKGREELPPEVVKEEAEEMIKGDLPAMDKGRAIAAKEKVSLYIQPYLVHQYCLSFAY